MAGILTDTSGAIPTVCDMCERPVNILIAYSVTTDDSVDMHEGSFNLLGDSIDVSSSIDADSSSIGVDSNPTSLLGNSISLPGGPIDVNSLTSPLNNTDVQPSPAGVSNGQERVAATSARTVAVGGKEYVVGGWVSYELDRREARWKVGGKQPGDRYQGKSYVYADDVVRSVATPSEALHTASQHLATVLGTIEDALCDPDEDGVWECRSAAALVPRGAPNDLITVPPVTSEDVREFGNEPQDAQSMYAMAVSLATLLGEAGASLPLLPPVENLPPLPSQAIAVGDSEGILRLERGSEPHLRSLEELQTALVRRFDLAADVLSAAIAGSDLAR